MKKLLISTLATAITLSSASASFAESTATSDTIQITPIEQEISPKSSRSVAIETGGTQYSYVGTAYGKIQNQSGVDFSIQIASVASISLGVYFAPAGFAGVAATPISFLSKSRPILYTKDIMQVRYTGKTRVIRHNVYVYSDSSRIKLIKSYWQETI
ncbi:hypothetical protein [Bacillus sp. AFS055030]|uniref:hypothetical protein n=1 Tax=Bacillus sp. AFS055030 TaxID=2033507 RepID=UPI000BFD92AB|nr:hypothetical protein [Bacillus sp. AFS055030]PGL73149.1 hypothetical protein CN925_01315 [Bacillus sp. AFS055030]